MVNKSNRGSDFTVRKPNAIGWLVMAMLLFVGSMALPTGFSQAHSGRTDSCGGHFERATGEYHVHNLALYYACYPPKPEPAQTTLPPVPEWHEELNNVIPQLGSVFVARNNGYFRDPEYGLVITIGLQWDVMPSFDVRLNALTKYVAPHIAFLTDEEWVSLVVQYNQDYQVKVRKVDMVRHMMAD